MGLKTDFSFQRYNNKFVSISSFEFHFFQYCIYSDLPKTVYKSMRVSSYTSVISGHFSSKCGGSFAVGQGSVRFSLKGLVQTWGV